MKLRTYRKLTTYIFPEWRELPIEHGLTTRLAGHCEHEAFGSFNLSLQGIEDPDLREAVHLNRQQFSEELAIPLSQMVTGKQVHSDNWTIVDDSYQGFDQGIDERLQANDALITAGKRLLLTWHADCVPIYYFDPHNRVVALAHAGWRGTYSDIAGKVVAALDDHFNTPLAALQVGIGPCALAASYEVGVELLEILQSEIGSTAERFFSPQVGQPQKLLLDLVALNRFFLQSRGVLGENIIGGDCDTVSCEQLFSHRRQGAVRGTNCAFIGLKS